MERLQSAHPCYVCRTDRYKPDIGCPQDRIDEKELEQTVLAAIRMMAQLVRGRFRRSSASPQKIPVTTNALTGRSKHTRTQSKCASRKRWRLLRIWCPAKSARRTTSISEDSAKNISSGLKPKSKSWGCQTAGKGRRTLHLQHHSLYQCQDIDTGAGGFADPKHLHLQFYFYRDRLEMRGRISTATCRYHKKGGCGA